MRTPISIDGLQGIRLNKRSWLQTKMEQSIVNVQAEGLMSHKDKAKSKPDEIANECTVTITSQGSKKGSSVMDQSGIGE